MLSRLNMKFMLESFAYDAMYPLFVILTHCGSVEEGSVFIRISLITCIDRLAFELLVSSCR